MAEDVDAVSADTDRLSGFVDAGARYVTVLSGLEAELAEARSLALNVLGDGPVADGLFSAAAFEDLLAAADRSNRFVGEVRDVLLTGRVSGRGARGRFHPDIGPSVHRVTSVEVDRGLWDAGLLELSDTRLSPTRRDLLTLDVLNGVPTGGPVADLILSRVLAPVTDRLRDRVAVAIEHGASPGDVGVDTRYFPPNHRSRSPVAELGYPFNRLEAIDVTGEYLGRGWQGRALADWYRAERPTDILGGSVFDTDRAPLSSVNVLAEQVSGSTDTAIEFFNSIGASGTAGLMAIRPEDQAWRYLDPDVVPRFSRALGNASRSGDLEFGGGDLIHAKTEGGAYLAPAVALLFSTGDFDSRFLADAAVAQLEHHDDHDPLNGGPYGPSGTNILIARLAESPKAGTDVINTLGAGRAHLYLQPGRAFQPAADGTYPITMFLAAAGADPETAAIMLSAAANLDGGFSDPGVAGGIDSVMARHATIMYPITYLRSRGISLDGRLNHGHWARSGHGGDDWKRVRELVLEHGQGAGLAAGTKYLIIEAMAADLLADGDLSADDERYRLMALNAGALDEQWFQRVMEIRAEEDLSATRKNNYVSAGISVGVALVGLFLLPATPAGAAIGFAAGVVTSGGQARFPIDIWTANLADTEARERLTDERHSERIWQDAVIAPIVLGAQQAGTPIRDEAGNILTIEYRDETPVLVATNPATGERTENPNPEWSPDGPVGDPRNDTASQIHRFYTDGQDFMDPLAIAPEGEKTPGATDTTAVEPGAPATGAYNVQDPNQVVRRQIEDWLRTPPHREEG